MPLRIPEYHIKAGTALKILLLADLHDRDCRQALDAIEKTSPDLILLAGDINETLGEPCADPKRNRDNKEGFRLLSECAKAAPSYYALGNHEKRPYPENTERILQTGVHFLDNSDEIFVCPDGTEILIGGLASGLKKEGILQPTYPPNEKWLSEFEQKPELKILINHHPEYWKPYICGKDVFLTVSGHAHGGQIRLFGHGLLAPGQGIFPKYDGGRFGSEKDGYLVVSRGLSNTARFIPRLFNPKEAPLILLEK